MVTSSESGLSSVRIVEVSPRDGLQNEAVEFSTAQKKQLVDYGVAAGAKNIEVTSFVHPRAVPAMADAEALVQLLEPTQGVTYSALILNQRGLDRAIAAGITEVNMVVHCTDAFSERNQGTDIAGGIRMWGEIARVARENGVTPNLTLAVAFGCPFEGEVSVDTVRRVAAEATAAGVPTELSLADTIGVGVPRDVAARFGAINSLVSGTETATRAHFHDTRSTGIANALAAIDQGVSILDTSLGGIGGCPFAPKATGNIATEDLAYALERSGISHGLDPEALRVGGLWLQEQLGRPVPSGVIAAGGFPQQQRAA